MRESEENRKTSAFMISACLFVILSCSLPEPANAREDYFAPLKNRLISDGIPARTVYLAFEPQPAPHFRIVAQTLHMRESKLNYDQFLDSISISRARRFADRYQDTLNSAEKKYGVDQSVIVAILLVETQFGQYTGRVPTLAVLSTFALMDGESSRDRIWAMLSADDRRILGREAFDRKLMDRARWAYQEVSALIRWTGTQGRDPQSFHGSVMGAIGWPQFLPSSLVRYGVDGNGDGRVDLFQPQDAVFSVGNYLKEHGWSGQVDRAGQEEVIYTYNKSRPYVLTILAIADRIRPSERSRQLSEAGR